MSWRRALREQSKAAVGADADMAKFTVRPAGACTDGIIAWLYGVCAAVAREDAGLGILRQRYARGEIGHDEYERMRDRLKK